MEPKLNSLDRLRIEEGEILDSSGRQVVLRGLVTITSYVDFTDRTPKLIDLEQRDFERMLSWGFNAQVIRLEGCRLGASPECTLDPDYLEKLDRWTTLAEQHRLYTIFKMTTYDIPSWGIGSAFNPERWQQFWDNKDGQQDVHLKGWQNLWKRFEGRSSVIGYDVLNEPHLGKTTRPFHRDHLFPYYRRASKALRTIDTEALLLFQSAPWVVHEEELEPLDDAHPLFVPHFYPRKIEMYERWIKSILKKRADESGYAMLIGEYGYPDREIRNFLPAWTVESGRATATLFDRYGLGSFRPWYCYSPWWGVLNADQSEQKEKMDILSRPYPQRTAGRQKGWSFDFDSRVFHLVIEPKDGVKGPSEIFVPLRRHYPNGFKLELNGAIYYSDKTEKTGLRVKDEKIEDEISFDFKDEILRINPLDQRVSLTIQPI